LKKFDKLAVWEHRALEETAELPISSQINSKHSFSSAGNELTSTGEFRPALTATLAGAGDTFAARRPQVTFFKVVTKHTLSE
jgi:hypothetical protein